VLAGALAGTWATLALPAALRAADAPAGASRWPARLSQGGWLRGTAPEGTSAVSLDGAPLPLAPDGSFFVGFDRDAGAAATLAFTTAAGVAETVPLAVAPRGWRIEAIDAPLRAPGVPDADYARRRAGEVALIAAARACRNGVDGWRQTMLRPAPGRTSGLFGSQRVYRGQPGAYHGGLDIAAPAGTPFVAPADGVVVLAAADPFTLEGRLLMLDHGMGLGSAFLHCDSHLVREGEQVRRGQPIGTVGRTGRATGPHLHWAVAWQNGTRLSRMDPLLLLG